MLKGFFALLALLIVAQTFQVEVSQTADDRVLIELYHESLCPYCREFLIGQAKKAVNTKDIWLIAEFKIYPYGNAKTAKNGTGYAFTCQHGVNECIGNVIQTCALKLYEPHQYAIPFIICIEENNTNWNTFGAKCAQQLGMDWNSILTCSNSAQGNQWQYEVGVATNALVPAHTYVPWVNVNGKHSTTTEDAVQTNMLGFICANYKGTVKIAACP